MAQGIFGQSSGGPKFDIDNDGWMTHGMFGPSSGGPKFNIDNDGLMAQGIFGPSSGFQNLTWTIMGVWLRVYLAQALVGQSLT